MTTETDNKSTRDLTDVIDWSAHDKYTEDTCECRCGRFFSSHGKFFANRLVSRKPCPGCGSNQDIMRIASDPTVYELKG